VVAINKMELLKKYSQKSVHQFIQIDGFNLDGRDDALKPDKDGDSLMPCETWELMSSCPPVRILIPAGNPPDKHVVARLLRKIVAVIERKGHSMPQCHSVMPVEPEAVAIAELTAGEREEIERRTIHALMPQECALSDVQEIARKVERLSDGDRLKGLVFGFDKMPKDSRWCDGDPF
jgi:hypothetical protein